MAMGVVFLASSLDQADPKPSSYKPGNTEVIRSMLREQQKDCVRLHANNLFKEFRDEGNKHKKVGKGYAPPTADSQPLVLDFHAEGQSRMFDLIKSRAVKDEKPLQGVWASFGKPYVCLGAPEEPNSKLPPLNRDAMQAETKGAIRRKKAVQAAQAAERPTSMRKRLSSGGSTRDGGGAGSLDLSPAEQEEMRLVRKKTQMRFGPADLVEVKFPEGPLRNAAARLVKSKVRVGSYADPDGAAAEAGDAEGAYGQPPMPRRQMAAVAAHSGSVCIDDNGGKTFMTQAGGGGHGEGEADHVTGGMQSMSLGTARASVSGRDIFGDEVVSGTCSPSQMPDGSSGAPPMFRRLVQPSVPERGREDDPVYGWHNKFVEVRQRARESLTQALYERSAGRFKARSYAKMGTNLAGLLMADLEQVKGKKTPYVSLRKAPENPYAKMEETWEQQEEARRARTQRAHALDPEELRVMQRFYDQLCALVEAQRTSDPLSLMVVHKVRAALEGGASLNRSLLSAIVDHVTDFSRGCGLMAHNKYVLAVLMFIAKCTGVPMPELDALVVNAGICVVVFGTGEPPQRDDEIARTARKPSTVNTRSLSTGRLASNPSVSRQATELDTAAENVLSQLPPVVTPQGEDEGTSPQLPQPATP